MSDKHAARWAATKARGRSRFVFLHGAVAGLIGAVIQTVITQWLGAPGPFWQRLAIALAVSPLFGFWFGRWMWSINERRYRARRPS